MSSVWLELGQTGRQEGPEIVLAQKPREEAKAWLSHWEWRTSPSARWGGRWVRNTQGSTRFRQGQSPVAASSLVDLGRLPRGEAFRSSLNEERNRLVNRLRVGVWGVLPIRAGKAPEETLLVISLLCLSLLCISLKSQNLAWVFGDTISCGEWVCTKMQMKAVGLGSWGWMWDVDV